MIDELTTHDKWYVVDRFNHSTIKQVSSDVYKEIISQTDTEYIHTHRSKYLCDGDVHPETIIATYNNYNLECPFFIEGYNKYRIPKLYKDTTDELYVIYENIVHLNSVEFLKIREKGIFSEYKITQSQYGRWICHLGYNVDRFIYNKNN